MKTKLSLLLGLLLVSCQPSYAALYDNTEMCLLHAEFANTTMEARQYGVSKPKLLSVLHEENKLVRVDKETINLYEAIVDDAYKQPVVPYEATKQSLISSFSNAVYNICNRSINMPDIFLLMEAETRQGVFEHSLIDINGLTHEQIHEQILLFVEDVYDTDGNKDFLVEEYYQINFDELFDKQHLLVNQRLHLSVVFGVNDFRLDEI